MIIHDKDDHTPLKVNTDGSINATTSASTAGTTVISGTAANLLAEVRQGTASNLLATVAGTVTVSSGTVQVSSGTVTVSSGTVQVSAGTVTVSSGTVQVSAGTVTVSSGTVQVSAVTGTVTVNSHNVTSGTASNLLAEVRQGTASNLLATVSGTVTVSSGTVQVSAGTVTVSSGTVQVSAGTVTVSSGTVQVSAVTGTVTINALAAGTAYVGHVAVHNELGTYYSGTTTVAPSYAAISFSSTGDNTIIDGTASKKIYILSGVIMSSTVTNARFWTVSTAGTALSGVMALPAGGGFQIPWTPCGAIATNATGVAVILNISAASTVGGWITYVVV